MSKLQNKPPQRLFLFDSISLFDKTPPKELLTNQDYQDVRELNGIQLKINYISMDTNEV